MNFYLFYLFFNFLSAAGNLAEPTVDNGTNKPYTKKYLCPHGGFMAENPATATVLSAKMAGYTLSCRNRDAHALRYGGGNRPAVYAGRRYRPRYRRPTYTICLPYRPLGGTIPHRPERSGTAGNRPEHAPQGYSRCVFTDITPPAPRRPYIEPSLITETDSTSFRLIWSSDMVSTPSTR